MSDESETPRTDARSFPLTLQTDARGFYLGGTQKEAVPARFARQLERELNLSRAECQAALDELEALKIRADTQFRSNRDALSACEMHLRELRAALGGVIAGDRSR